ncbi:hypothetical protein [Nostoc sp. C110]|uniref:hypothetical protein n=1 Tax=Nostoc sp. C110 TaxID=3349876 RepID=UPI00370D6085
MMFKLTKIVSKTLSFLPFFIASLMVMISAEVISKYYKEIEEYKVLTLWYEHSDNEIKDGNNLQSVVEKIQSQLEKDVDKILQSEISEEVITNTSDKISPDAIIKGKPIKWEIEKTGSNSVVSYDYTRLIDFNNLNNQNREQVIKNSINDETFLLFTYQITTELSGKFKTNDIDTDNFNKFSNVLMVYLTGSDDYLKQVPYLRVENIYVFKEENGVVMSYPSNNKKYDSINYKTRPWFRATLPNDNNNKYSSNYVKNSKYGNTGLTKVYVDVNDKYPNAIRTLWYDLNIPSKGKYILCVDLFLDKISTLSKEQNLNGLQSIQSRLDLKDIWIYLLFSSLIISLPIFSIYELFGKNFILKTFNYHSNNLVKIKLQRETRHYASKDEGEIKFTIQGETKEINKSEQSMEAKWSFNIQNIQAGILNSQTLTAQKEATYSYEFVSVYNLNMSENKPQYRCIETWRVVIESQANNIQKIGFFVVKWDTNNSASIENGLDIKSIYWEKNYQEYLDVIKEQLHEQLLISDEKEFVAILDTNYSRRQNIPSYITGIDSLKQVINNSLYLKQGKIVFSEVKTLAELYKQGQVKAICTLFFLKKLVENNQFKNFFQTPINERYLIENKQDEFRKFYDSLDDESKLVLINQSPFQIMKYQDNINNIVTQKDDFSIISINNIPKLVTYSFTDNQYSNMGWISWREVDIKFYEELYKCQKDKGQRVENIQTYLTLKSP